ncbi:DUF58 domain-containing protein [Saccharobesus litoralis]|uniref:DUF58 domain-containing protein n=1 Tax=Saccharobesus litoralis TaxID=2172099 RepID=UPI00131F0630|nr:DUF58 domain-containing protein [Saccharobesus litoralis]
MTLLLKVTANGHDQPMIFAYLGAVILAIIGLVDWLRSNSTPTIEVERQLPNNISFNRWQNVDLHFRNNSTQPYVFTFSEHTPNEFETELISENIALSANQQANKRYRIKPTKRGNYQITSIELCINSPWRFWQQYWLIELNSNIKVYPDFNRLNQGQNLNGVSTQMMTGLKLQKKRGEGIEFHQLRDFRQGDSVRQIDWQATSKRQKLISKEYQEEQNQHVIVMLDAGQRMNIETHVGTHFDAALNALLMLSHTVLKQGDWFSMQSFGQHERWLAGVKGAQNVSRVMNHFYDLYPDESASDYSQAVQNLLTKRSKRALILLVTTINDQDLNELLPAIKRLQQHHLVALINIENQGLKEALAEPITDASDANSYCAAIALHNQYQLNLKRLRKENVICVDTKPELLLPYVVNTYLNVKHSGLL